MDADIKLDGATVTIEGDTLAVRGTDLVLDNADRRKMHDWKPAPDRNPRAPRRALVHDGNDGLTLNFGRDYPGGVSIEGEVHVPGPLLVVAEEGAPHPANRMPDGQVVIPATSGLVTLDVGRELVALRAAVKALREELDALKARVP